MFTFYSFYITWSTIISLGSIISLALIINNNIHNNNINNNNNNNNNNSVPEICDVNIPKFSFDIFNLMYFCLVTRILFGIIQMFTYCATYKEENSVCRRIINLVMFLFYTISIIGLILIAKQFTENNGCYNYYVANYKYVLFSYISIDIIYMIESIAFVIAIITYMCTCKHRESYEYDKYQRF
jgi:hypothetical protein